MTLLFIHFLIEICYEAMIFTL